MNRAARTLGTGLVGIVGLLGSACRPPAPPPSAPVPSSAAVEPDLPSASAPPTSPPEAGANPSVPTGTLVVPEVRRHADVLVNRGIEVEGRLQWKTFGCTRSQPPSCQGRWELADDGASGGKPVSPIPLDTGAVTVPTRCIPSGGLSGSAGPASACPSGTVLDPELSVLVHGTVRIDAEGPVIVVARITSLGPPGGPHGIAALSLLPDRFLDRSIEIEAQVDWVTTGCTPEGSCAGSWHLRDAQGAGVASRVWLEPPASGVPRACVPLPPPPKGVGRIGTPSACPAGEKPDPAVFHALRGQLSRERRGLVFTATSIELRDR